MGAEKNQKPRWLARWKEGGKKLLLDFGRRWASAVKWYHVLEPARVCVLASLLVWPLFIYVDQGSDILRLVASQVWTRPMRACWMVFGMLLAGLTSWAWAWLLLSSDFLASRQAHDLLPEEAGRARKYRRRLRRGCGLSVPAGMAVGFGCAAKGSGCEWKCVLLAAVSVAVGAGLWFSFDPLRQRIREARAVGETERRFARVGEIKSDPLGRATLATFAVAVLVFVFLTLAPVYFGESLGSAAVILFAITLWTGVGGWLTYLASRFRVPLFGTLLLAAVLFSFRNDNHAVRVLPAAAGAGKPPSLAAALNQWHDQVTRYYPMDSRQKRPLYLVAAAGGGIRAAYWTALVLAELEDSARSNKSSFASHAFVMSGVSGGALGEVTFAGLVAHPPGGGTNFMVNARTLLGEDFLAADLAKMAGADLLQRFLPWRFTCFDRARALEDSWAAPWREAFHTDVLNESIGQLYTDADNAHVILPHLLLNGTCVETGQRIITSDLTISSRVKAVGRADSDGEFLDVMVAADKLKRPIRLSTAAHQSARFTYFSPAGRFPDGTHVVDGGYFENSGASTLMDAFEAIRWHLKANHWTNIEERVVLIDNDPIPLRPATNRYRWMGESLSPVRALLNTRTARGNDAVEQALTYDWTGTNGMGTNGMGAKVFQFNLFQRDEQEPLGDCKTPRDLPLGWTLSESAMDEMDQQLTLPFARATNSAIISQIVATLPPFQQPPP